MTAPTAYTVIIPTYNRKETLCHALDSVLSQTVPAQSVIVVDDGSTDETGAMLEQVYPQVTVLTQDNQGVSAARNRGISATVTPWIALLDSDDRWLPKKIERQFEAIQNAPTTRLFHTEEIWIRNGVRVNQMKKHRKSGGDVFARSLQLCCISPSSVLMHRTLFEQYGLFDTELPACEDYDLWLRIAAGEAVGFVTEPLTVKYGGHADQLSRAHWGMDRFRVYAIEKLLLGGTLNAEQAERARQTLVKKLDILSNGARKRGQLDDVAAYQEKRAKWAEHG
ncbi:MAG: glycosyltransferase family 2 protein [Bradymonadia bacterium]